MTSTSLALQLWEVQVDLKLPHGESGGRGDSQVDLLIISLTAENLTGNYKSSQLWEPVRGLSGNSNSVTFGVPEDKRLLENMLLTQALLRLWLCMAGKQLRDCAAGVVPSPCFSNFLARTTFVLESLPEAKNPGQDILLFLGILSLTIVILEITAYDTIYEVL